MPSALYRPPEQNLNHNHLQHQYVPTSNYPYLPLSPVSGISPSPKLGARHSRSTRRFVGLVLAFLFGYLLWCSLATTTSPSRDEIDNELTSEGTLGHGVDDTNMKILNETFLVCNEVFTDTRLYIENKQQSEYNNLPVIYFVTPTYPRREQVPELTRLAHTLLHVARLHWIVANDFETCNVFLDYLLNKFGIPYTHLASPMPNKFRTMKPAPRGVANRRAALMWLRQHNITNGILYFGDDDNTYDLKLFSEIRQTHRVSMFTVGLVGEYSVSGPVVKNGNVVGFLDSWVANRRWPVDMAGFAVNLGYMSQYPNVNMPFKPGFEEDLFLRSIGLTMNHIEPKGTNCTEILVWHTQTKNKKSPSVRIKNELLDDRLNLHALFKALEIMGVAKISDQDGINAILSKNGKAKPYSLFLS